VRSHRAIGIGLLPRVSIPRSVHGQYLDMHIVFDCYCIEEDKASEMKDRTPHTSEIQIDIGLLPQRDEEPR
jgi:hypothetical protein